MEESHIYAIANDVEVGEGKYPAISAQRREKVLKKRTNMTSMVHFGKLMTSGQNM